MAFEPLVESLGRLTEELGGIRTVLDNAATLTEIEGHEFGATRLWSAAEGVCEDDSLGLALIANRRK